MRIRSGRPGRTGFGDNDLYIKQELLHQQFCADVPDGVAMVMAATQRPLRDVTLTDTSAAPLWKERPSWFVLPELDRNIPHAVHRVMAERARPIDSVEVAGSSHTVGVSHPDVVADMIRAAVKHV